MDTFDFCDGPEYPDGCDDEGFPGGCERMHPKKTHEEYTKDQLKKNASTTNL